MDLKKVIFALLVTAWAFAVGIGFVWITDYSTKPSIPAHISKKLPAGIFAESNSTRPKMVLFIHPKCACSRATLNELARIVAGNEDSVEIKAIFYKPNGISREWLETDLWETARIIPNVEIATMTEAEIKRFGAVTSGQTILYDADGNVEFSGGITLSRGHEGMSTGRSSVESILNGGDPKIRETPVFGCLLTSEYSTF